MKVLKWLTDEPVEIIEGNKSFYNFGSIRKMVISNDFNAEATYIQILKDIVSSQKLRFISIEI
jgi:hypothetical protein